MTSNDSPSAWAPLRHKWFRTLFIAQLVSNIGLWMETVGAQWFLVENHAGPTVIALVQTASMAPTLILSLIAGTIADSVDKRRLLIGLSIYSGLVSTTTATLAFTGNLTSSSLLVMTFLLGAGGALTSPPWQAIQPELVSREEIPAAASLGSVTVNAARSIGPALGGLIVSWAGPAAVFALNAASYLAVVLALAAWRRPPEKRTAGREHFGMAVRVGVRYLFAAPVVRRILLRSALFAFPASALWALLPTAASDHLGVGSAGYGGILAVLGGGSVLGVVLMPASRKYLSTNGALVVSALVFGAATALLPTAPLWLVLPVLLLAGIAWILTLTTLNAGLQLTLPAWVRARGMAMYLLVFMGSQSVGSLFWGAIAAPLGYRDTLLIAAGFLVIAALTVKVWPLLSTTGNLSRDLSMAWPVPTLVFEPDPDDGPILVSVEYRVRDGATREFADAMPAVARARRRTGGRNWQLYFSADDDHLAVEQFIVDSWAEYRRQHAERWTAYDHEVAANAVSYTVDGTATEKRFFYEPMPTSTGSESAGV